MTCDSLWTCITAPLAFGFMQRGLAAAILIGIVCAVIGAFVVLQELAFIGDALAHASFPGVVIAFLLKFNLALGGAVIGILTALGIGMITRRSKLSQDTAIGVLFAGTFALGVALLSTVKNYTKDLFGLLLGDVLAIQKGDLIVIAVMGVLMLLIVFALYKELVLLTFDPSSGRGDRPAGGPAARAAAGADGRDDRDLDSDGRYRAGGGDAGDAGRDRARCWCGGSRW